MLVGFTFPAFIYMKLGASGHSPGLSSPGSIVPSTGSLNESVTTASTPLLVPGTANRRDAVWILSALLVCLRSLYVIALSFGSLPSGIVYDSDCDPVYTYRVRW